MTVYIDENFLCHTKFAEGRRAFQLPFFQGKCDRFVEGYRYLPPGETWGGFRGEMLCPAENFELLSLAQQVYDSLQPQLNELRERFESIRECFEGLSSNPGLEQLLDFINTIREMMEDFDA